jgi:hypothetical protein
VLYVLYFAILFLQMQGFAKSRKNLHQMVTSPGKSLGEAVFTGQGTRRRHPTGAIWSPGSTLRRACVVRREPLSAKCDHLGPFGTHFAGCFPHPANLVTSANIPPGTRRTSTRRTFGDVLDRISAKTAPGEDARPRRTSRAALGETPPGERSATS